MSLELLRPDDTRPLNSYAHELTKSGCAVLAQGKEEGHHRVVDFVAAERGGVVFNLLAWRESADRQLIIDFKAGDDLMLTISRVMAALGGVK